MWSKSHFRKMVLKVYSKIGINVENTTQWYIGAQVRTGTCRLKEEESPNQQ